MQRDWNLLATSSHYKTAVAVHEELRVGNIDNAITGLEELIEALSRSDERAMESYLTRLMQHIIKWKLQPERRTPSWVSTIRYTRRQIRKLQKENPRFTDDWIRAHWHELLEGSVDEAQTDIGQEIDEPPLLTWAEVFDVEYRVEKRDC